MCSVEYKRGWIPAPEDGPYFSQKPHSHYNARRKNRSKRAPNFVQSRRINAPAILGQILGFLSSGLAAKNTRVVFPSTVRHETCAQLGKNAPGNQWLSEIENPRNIAKLQTCQGCKNRKCFILDGVFEAGGNNHVSRDNSVRPNVKHKPVSPFRHNSSNPSASSIAKIQ